MASLHDGIDAKLRRFIQRQKIFFVATAPTEGGHVNLSPKGLDSLRVVDDRTVAYLDLTGSGAETIAHLRQNGRITLMFTAFKGAPSILRLYGQGRVVLQADGDWPGWAARFPTIPGTRAFIVVDVTRVQTACGYAVPLYEWQADRDTLVQWAERKGEDGLSDYRAGKNAESIDGLPAL